MLLTPLICFDALINLLLPRACLLCRTPTREKHHLCQPCLKELPILYQSCRKCAQFLHARDGGSLVCGSCLTKPPPYDQVFALFPYQPPLPRLIAGLKFEEQFSHATLFSNRLVHAVRRQWYTHSQRPDFILPMPLHTNRLRERGYNQALEVARPAAKALSIPLDHSITRCKATLPQHTLPASKRRQNVAKAFIAQRNYHGEHIAIVDDVMTTGQTVAALARLLKRHGARRVDIWCIARCDSQD